jgi:hypothetical protein
MGKGGDAKPKKDIISSLEHERQEKIAKAPQFYWASGDSMEEPHVQRYVLSKNQSLSPYSFWILS